MKKYVFLGGLIGFLLGLNFIVALLWNFDFTLSIYEEISSNLGLSFIAEKLAIMIDIGGDIGVGMYIFLVFLIPIVVYGFLGYILAFIVKRK